MQQATQKKVGADLTQGSIWRLLFMIGVPLVISNLVQQLYGSVDMMVVGKFVGSESMVGVSVGGEIASLLTFVASSFGMAGQIYVAQLIGAKNRDGVRETFCTLLTGLLIISGAFLMLCLAFCDVLLAWLNTPPEAYAEAKIYMQIVSLGLPAVFGYNAINGVLCGSGETKKPLQFTLVAGAVNIIVDVVFVVVFGWGAAGTAWATILSQYAAFAAAALFIKSREKLGDMTFHGSPFHIYPHRLKTLLRLGLPLTAQSAMIHLTMLYCTACVNAYGLAASAISSVGTKVNRVVNVATASITGATGAIVGQNLGAKLHDRVKKIVRCALVAGFVLFCFEAALALLLPRQLFSLFSSDAQVLDGSAQFMRISLITFGLAAIQAPLMSVVTGSGRSGLGFLAGLLDGVVLRLGISLLFANALHMGYVGYFYGNALARVGPVVVGALFYISGTWKKRSTLV